MNRLDSKSDAAPHNLASLLRGFYRKVAEQVGVDASYVSRVARGERRSDEIEAALSRELKRIMTFIRTHANGNGNGKRVAKTKRAKSKSKLGNSLGVQTVHAGAGKRRHLKTGLPRRGKTLER
jgi:hypothetical protein